jgi:hypothetical protein
LATSAEDWGSTAQFVTSLLKMLLEMSDAGVEPVGSAALKPTGTVVALVGSVVTDAGKVVLLVGRVVLLVGKVVLLVGKVVSLIARAVLLDEAESPGPEPTDVPPWWW